MTASRDYIENMPDNWSCMPMRRCVVLRQNGAWGDEVTDEEELEGVGEYCVRAADFDYRHLRFNPIDTFVRRRYDSSSFLKVQLKEGDIVIEKSGGGEKVPVGRALRFCGNDKTAFSNFMERQRVDESLCLSKFYFYWWTALYQHGVFTQYIKQTTGIQNLDGFTLLANELIALPPLEEQAKIVACLESGLNRSFEEQKYLERQIDVLERYRRSVIHEAVTKGLDPNVPMKGSGVEWIGEIPQKWKSKRLKYLTAFGNVQSLAHFHSSIA